MPLYGSPDFKIFLLGGRSVLSATSEVSGPEVENLTEEDTPPGATFLTHTAVGLKKVMFSANGWYDDAEDGANDAYLNGQTGEQILCLGLEGNTIGKKFIGIEGAITAKYARVLVRNGLTRANASLVATGALSDGVILQPWETKTLDWNTEATSFDSGASSAAGGVAFLQVSAFSGFTGFIGAIRHSDDDITFVDLVAFDDVTAGPTAQRKAVAGAVEQFLAFDGDVTGTGSITAFAGFARS